MHFVRFSFRYTTESGHIMSVGPGKHAQLPERALEAAREKGALGSPAEMGSPQKAPENRAANAAPTSKPRRGRRRTKG